MLWWRLFFSILYHSPNECCCQNFKEKFVSKSNFKYRTIGKIFKIIFSSKNEHADIVFNLITRKQHQIWKLHSLRLRLLCKSSYFTQNLTKYGDAYVSWSPYICFLLFKVTSLKLVLEMIKFQLITINTLKICDSKRPQMRQFH